MSSIIASVPSWIIPTLLVLTSIITLTIILERGWLLMHRINLIEVKDEMQLLEFIRKKKFDDAESFCRLQNHPAYKVALGIIEARNGHIDLKHVSEEIELRQITYLEKYLPSLGSISTVAPLLGLLGTVTGMIRAFRAYAQTASRSSQLVGGLDEALISTAMGLMVAIPALIFFNYFIGRVNTYISETNLLTDMVLKEMAKDANRKK
ncbi:MAG: MotA/TolQ/ExbB proton channel family protein [Spirochaetia bacterium]|nr:MotA/TolQ/ExbB proton channel family protein [Spirochaetia bacterium]